MVTIYRIFLCYLGVLENHVTAVEAEGGHVLHTRGGAAVLASGGHLAQVSLQPTRLSHAVQLGQAILQRKNVFGMFRIQNILIQIRILRLTSEIQYWILFLASLKKI